MNFFLYFCLNCFLFKFKILLSRRFSTVSPVKLIGMKKKKIRHSDIMYANLSLSWDCRLNFDTQEKSYKLIITKKAGIRIRTENEFTCMHHTHVCVNKLNSVQSCVYMYQIFFHGFLAETLWGRWRYALRWLFTLVSCALPCDVMRYHIRAFDCLKHLWSMRYDALLCVSIMMPSPCGVFLCVSKAMRYVAVCGAYKESTCWNEPKHFFLN